MTLNLVLILEEGAKNRLERPAPIPGGTTPTCAEQATVERAAACKYPRSVASMNQPSTPAVGGGTQHDRR